MEHTDTEKKIRQMNRVIRFGRLLTELYRYKEDVKPKDELGEDLDKIISLSEALFEKMQKKNNE